MPGGCYAPANWAGALPDDEHTAAYEKDMQAWQEYRGIEAFVDHHTGEFTRRPSVRIPTLEGE